jgi:parvulin-like peptidyl-prolyl isomerase
MKTLADRVLKKQSELTAKAMAAELIALMIEEGKMTEKTENGKTFYAMDPAVFEAYGKQYTSDTGGVLYDNVKQNQMVKKFENWLFDDSRVVGEVSSEAVETSYGYHIMLYRGDEKPAWSYAIRVSLAEGRYDAWMEQILKDTPVVEKAQNLDHVA